MTHPPETESYRDWIGREDHGVDIVTPELVKRFLATLDLPSGAIEQGDAAPVGIHWCLAPWAFPTAELSRDGHPERGDFLPPVALPRRMWAGGILDLARPIRIGDQVTRISRVEDIVQKQGRTGPLCFVTVRHVLSVGTHEVTVERQDIVYRGPDVAPIAAPAPGPAAEWSKAVIPSEPLLFRYSALTFNAHRIHYDRRFCQEVEAYPGLVVHGPLQATLLLHFATDLKHGEPPRHFVFRSSAPLFDGPPFRVCATATETGLQLWTETAAGSPAMRAEASW